MFGGLLRMHAGEVTHEGGSGQRMWFLRFAVVDCFGLSRFRNTMNYVRQKDLGKLELLRWIKPHEKNSVFKGLFQRPYYPLFFLFLIK